MKASVVIAGRFVGCIFAATTINYLDRNVLGLLKPVRAAAGVFGDDKVTGVELFTGLICFQVAYATGAAVCRQGD